MKLNHPLVQLTLALVLLTTSLVLVADMFFNVLPSHADEQQRTRQRVAELLAVQITSVMKSDNDDALRGTLHALARRLTELQSLAVRRNDGKLLADSGGHEQRWRGGDGQAALRHQISVPLQAGEERWGAVEVLFQRDDRPALVRWLDEPAFRLVVFLSLAGAVAYGLYMRRALQHLDPASVIPDRVQRAFDALSEGVAVLDARGRILLVNRSFHRLHPDAGQVRTGQPLSALPWLGAGLSADAAEHPWARSMSQRGNTSGDTLRIGQDVAHPRQLLVNCAPITDAGGTVRGCLATFDDVTQLHRANLALQEAMTEVSAAKEEVQRKNAELVHLAMRDPLTGCLNRRALYEAMEPLLAKARQTGLPVGCLMIDIDHFKLVNDTHGHAVGDRVIQEVARKLQEGSHGTDLVCRYGGEEFCIVVPGLDADGVLGLAERLRASIEAACGAAVHEVPGLRVTVSIGFQANGQRQDSAQKMIDRADQALYEAKRGGRNRVAEFTS